MKLLSPLSKTDATAVSSKGGVRTNYLVFGIKGFPVGKIAKKTV